MREQRNLLKHLTLHLLRIAYRHAFLRIWVLLSSVAILVASGFDYFGFGSDSSNSQVFVAASGLSGGVLTITYFYLVTNASLHAESALITARPVSIWVFYLGELFAGISLNVCLFGLLLLVHVTDVKLAGNVLNQNLLLSSLACVVQLVGFCVFCCLVMSASRFWSLVTMVGGFFLGQIAGSSQFERESGVASLISCVIPDLSFTHTTFGITVGFRQGCGEFSAYFASYIILISIAIKLIYGIKWYAFR